MRSPSLLLMRMKAAETSASKAMADWTPLTVVPRSVTTAEIDTFIRDVSTTRTNIAAGRSRPRRMLVGASVSGTCDVAVAIGSSAVGRRDKASSPREVPDGRRARSSWSPAYARRSLEDERSVVLEGDRQCAADIGVTRGVRETQDVQIGQRPFGAGDRRRRARHDRERTPQSVHTG